MFSHTWAVLWVAVAPEPEGRARRLINAGRTELTYDKQTGCPVAVSGRAEGLLPSVVETTFLPDV